MYTVVPVFSPADGSLFFRSTRETLGFAASGNSLRWLLNVHAQTIRLCKKQHL
jgi:hypothetical protein